MRLGTTTGRRRIARVRGRAVALVMVLGAIAIAVIVSLSFAYSSNTTIGISRNATDHARARHIAESGLVMYLGALQKNPDWRTTLPSGTWASDVSYASGTYVVTGNDGVDTNGDGVVEGDGDLSDDTTDPVTIRAIGQYRGTSHSISAVLTPGGSIPITQVGALDKVEVKGSASIDSWNSSVGSYDVTKGSDAVISTSSRRKGRVKIRDTATVKGDAFAPPGGNPDVVIQVGSHASVTGTTATQSYRQLVPAIDRPTVASPSGNVIYASGTTLVNSDKSINYMEAKSSATVQIDGAVIIYVAGNLLFKDYAQLTLAAGASVAFYVEGEITFEGNARINYGGDPSKVIFYSLTKKRVELRNNVDVYGVFVAPGSEVKVRDEAELFGSFVGRKLKVEHSGKVHQDLNPFTVPTGTVIYDNGGADYGLAADLFMELKDDAQISGFGTTARVSVNAIASDKLRIGDRVSIDGDVYVGPTGNPDVVIDCNTSLSSVITGEVGVSELSVAIEEDNVPFTGTPSDLEIASGTYTASADAHYRNLTLKGTTIINVSGDVTVQVDGDFKMQDTAEVRVSAGSSLTLYLGKNCDFENYSRMNVSAGDPTAVTIHAVGTEDVVLEHFTTVYATVVVPYDRFNVKGDAKFYGTARASQVKIENRGQVFIATEEGSGPPDLSGGQFTVRWAE